MDNLKALALLCFVFVMYIFAFVHLDESKRKQTAELSKMKSKVEQLERELGKLNTDQRAFENHIQNIVYERY